MNYYDDKGRRLNIIQDPDELLDRYLHKLNYDPEDRIFLRYVTSRTGYHYTLGKVPDPEKDYSDLSRQVDQCRLQDCWESLNQPGFREKFAMKLLLRDMNGK